MVTQSALTPSLSLARSPKHARLEHRPENDTEKKRRKKRERRERTVMTMTCFARQLELRFEIKKINRSTNYLRAFSPRSREDQSTEARNEHNFSLSCRSLSPSQLQLKLSVGRHLSAASVNILPPVGSGVGVSGVPTPLPLRSGEHSPLQLKR